MISVLPLLIIVSGSRLRCGVEGSGLYARGNMIGSECGVGSVAAASGDTRGIERLGKLAEAWQT